jgi:hypothetical protein
MHSMKTHALNPAKVMITHDVLDSFESETISRFSKNKFKGFLH